MNSQLFIKAMNSATAWLSEYIKLRDMWGKVKQFLRQSYTFTLLYTGH